MDDRHEILELARFLTELSVIDFYFVVHRPSDVALAALLNSIEAVTGGSSESASMVFQTELRRVRGFSDPSKPEVSDCRNRLQILYSRGGYSRPEARESRDETVPSPVSVAFGVHLPEVLSSKEHCENHDELDAPGNLDDIGIDDTDSHIDMAGWIWIRRPSAKQRPQ
jgi:Cyclin, C-terminal domain